MCSAHENNNRNVYTHTYICIYIYVYITFVDHSAESLPKGWARQQARDPFLVS